MSNQDPWVDPNSPQPAVQKKGLSGCMLASLIVGGLGLVMVLTCCGIGFWLGPSLVPKETKDPVQVTDIAQGILKFELPPDFTPEQALTWDLKVFTTRFAEFKHKEGKGAIFILSFKVNFGDPKQTELQAKQFSNPAEEKIKGSLDIQKSVTRNLTIAGKEVPVTFAEGTDKNQNGKLVHLVSGKLDAPMAGTLFIIRLDDEIWDEEAVEKMLEEAKLP